MSVISPSARFLGTFDGLTLVLREFRDRDDPDALAMLLPEKFKLALVNKLWRYVVLNTPILWRTVHVAPGLPDSHPIGARQRFLPTYILRSGSLPMIICITGNPKPFERIPACVAATSERWTNLRVGLERNKIGGYLGIVQNKISMLRSLTLAPRFQFESNSTFPGDDETFDTSMFAVAPSLQILTVMYYPVENLVDPRKFPVAQIRCLKYIIEQHTFDGSFLWNILRTFPAIQCLSLENVTWWPLIDAVEGSVLHKELRMLDLSFDEPIHFSGHNAIPQCIFTVMNLPVLDTLRLALAGSFDTTSHWPQREFCKMLNRSRSSLRALVLSDVVLESAYVLEMLSCVPELTHLEITFFDTFYRDGSLCDAGIMINPGFFKELTVIRQVYTILPKLTSLTLGTRWTPELIQACVPMLESRMHRISDAPLYPGRCLRSFLYQHYPEDYNDFPIPEDDYEENHDYDALPEDNLLKKYGARLIVRPKDRGFDLDDETDCSLRLGLGCISQDTVRERTVDGVDPAFIKRWHEGVMGDLDILAVMNFEHCISRDNDVDMDEEADTDEEDYMDEDEDE